MGAEQELDPHRESALAPRPDAAARGLAEARPTAPARRESEELYRTLYESIPLMYFQLDRRGTVLSVNEHGARELGYARDELVGRSVLGVFHPDDRRAAERQLGWALECPQEVARWELRKVRKSGSMLWVRETVRVVHGSEGEPRVLVVCEDVTDLKRAVARVAEYRDQLRELNAELLRAEERENRRIARVLHDELGQTLAAARMAICELKDTEPSAPRAAHLEQLCAHLDRSIEVTRSLTFQLSPPILHDLGLAPALQALGERTEEERGIRFAYELGEGWSAPGGHAGGVLYRVVRELLHNVVKHARARRVRLRLGGDRERIRIVLEDNGVGFEAASSDAVGGDGLGLFQARERMERLGGGFEIDSGPGRGTRVRLTLPIGRRVERRRSDRRKSR